jgi:hypothetical protein
VQIDDESGKFGIERDSVVERSYRYVGPVRDVSARQRSPRTHAASGELRDPGGTRQMRD